MPSRSRPRISRPLSRSSDGEGEHAEEVVDAVGAPPVVGLGDHLGVGGGEEPVTVSPQLLAQLLVVVDAAVEHRDQPQFVVNHRLGAGLGQVDDRQSAVGQRDRTVMPEPVPIRSPWLHHGGDPVDRGDIGRASRRTGIHRSVRTRGSPIVRWPQAAASPIDEATRRMFRPFDLHGPGFTARREENPRCPIRVTCRC